MFRPRINFDKLVARLVSLGVPGLVLVVVAASTGLTGGAAIVAALAALGGPAGMWGGVAVLLLLVLITYALAEYGFETLFVAVLRGLKRKGLTKEQILKSIDSYPISIGLKLKLRMYVEQFWNGEGPAATGAVARTRPPAPQGGISEAKSFPPES
jgi:hypothetical protein